MIFIKYKVRLFELLRKMYKIHHRFLYPYPTQSEWVPSGHYIHWLQTFHTQCPEACESSFLLPGWLGVFVREVTWRKILITCNIYQARKMFARNWFLNRLHVAYLWFKLSVVVSIMFFLDNKRRIWFCRSCFSLKTLNIYR